MSDTAYDEQDDGIVDVGSFVLEGHGKYWSLDEDFFKMAEVEPWCSVPDRAVALAKEAQSSDRKRTWVRALAESILAINPMDREQSGFFTTPTPLTSMLVGGLLGAGLGYGGGALASFVLPRTWRRRNLRRTMAIAGALVGMSPGLLIGLTNWLSRRPFNDNTVMTGHYGYVPVSRPPQSSIRIFDREAPVKSGVSLWSVAALETGNTWDSFQKAAEGVSLTGLEGIPPISPNDFHMTIWGDPRVANRLSLPMRAAASGVVAAAANLPGKQVRLVTPMDMARVSAGMGSGYVSGWLVGKALGALMGMPESAQDRLKQVGLWSGVVANVIPVMFGA